MTFVAALESGIKVSIKAPDADVALFRLRKQGYKVASVRPL